MPATGHEVLRGSSVVEKCQIQFNWGSGLAHGTLFHNSAGFLANHFFFPNGGHAMVCRWITHVKNVNTCASTLLSMTLYTTHVDAHHAVLADAGEQEVADVEPDVQQGSYGSLVYVRLKII